MSIRIIARYYRRFGFERNFGCMRNVMQLRRRYKKHWDKFMSSGSDIEEWPEFDPKPEFIFTGNGYYKVRRSDIKRKLYERELERYLSAHYYFGYKWEMCYDSDHI